MKQIKIVYELAKPDPRPKKQKKKNYEAFMDNNDERVKQQGKKDLSEEQYFKEGKR